MDLQVRLQLESDSDSPGDRDGEGGAQLPVHGGRGGSPSPPPVDRPAVTVPPADAGVLVQAADGGAPQVHTCIYMVHVMLVHYMCRDPLPREVGVNLVY